MEENEQEQRRRKVEAGRAKLAHFQQRKAKGDGTHSKKKTAKRKGSTVDAPVPEESPVAAGDGGLLREREAGKGTLSSDTPEKIEGALVAQHGGWSDCLVQLHKSQHFFHYHPVPPGTSVHALELEALRLSLSNMHTAQLELTQANLQKEKEAALTELREMLNGLRAQELALAQSRQQSELARIREQHEREREVLALQCGQEAAELKEKLESEVEKNVQIIETLKRDWESERELCLENLRKELSEKHQSELENLRNQFKRELAEQKAELEKIFQAKNQAECALKDLETQHEAALQHLREELQSQHCQHLEDLELKCTEKEKEKQLELEHLQASYEELKAQSQEEIKRLWSQLDSLRASRQGGQELDQQLLAPVSSLEELEQLKRDFEQRQQREKTEHEADLEQLRIYFEKKLRDAEKNYQEDLTLLQQRLQEVKEDSFLEYAEISPSSTFLEETAEKERKEHLDQLKLQLEQHEAKCNLVEDHQEEVRKTKEKVQLMRQELKEKEEEWKVTREDLKRKAEEKLTLMLLELREKTESEKQAIIDKFELRETEMRQLQGEQATQILELARSLAEQQSRLQQLELGVAGDEPPRCSQCGPAAEAWERTTLRLKEDCALQLMLAQNRFLEERKQMMEKFAVEHDTTLQVLQEKHMGELQLLQDSHRQRIVSLTAELQAEHQAEMGALKVALESEQRALLETHVAELQTRQTAELSALEVKHLSNLDSLESCYLSAIQILRDEHRQALKQLSTDLEEQLRKKDSFHQIVLTQELEKLKLKHDEELQGAKDSLRIEMSTKHVENLKAMAAELQRAHQEELAAALHAQRRLLEKEKSSALDRVGAEVVLVEQQHQTALREPRDMHVAEVQLPQEEAVQAKELQEKEHHIQQLKDQITSLSNEIEECHSELEKLQQRRERENQEGTNLISMLKSDIDLSHSERNALQDALRRLLSLFGETVRAAVAIKSQISERVGLCLDDVGATGTESPPKVWPSVEALCAGEHTAPLEPDGTLLESAEVSVVAEISSHVCESFFMSPEATLEYEQPIRKVYQSLRVAVNSLLEMALDSSRQLEEAHQIHARFEKEFNYKNEETAQVIRQQKELLDCLSEESSATAALTRELHQAHGLIEGFKEERADLQVALDQKEQSEQCLVLELEHLSQQLQAATQEQAQLKEECAALQSQKEVLAAGAQEREAGLRKEVECLMKEQLETRKQSEKDRAALLSQLQVLESELEEQVSRHQACAQYADEVVALKQQMASLDKHLRSQRQFMDEQAAEREHERDEFQQEIQRLEEQLRRAARPQATGARDSHSMQPSEEVELLQEKLREKSDGFNELAVKKELADRRLAVQQEEIQSLEVAVAEAGRRAAQLQEELEMQRRIGEELQQDKEALQKQQMNHLILVSALQTELEEAKCRVPPVGSPAGAAEAQPEAVLQALPQHVREAMGNRSPEVEELKSIIGNLQENQARLQKEKAEEIEQLHEVIEKLQKELSPGVPVGPEISDSPAESLRTELERGLLGVHEVAAEDVAESGPHVQALQAELEMALAGRAALGQLLEEREQEHRQALEALGQSLRATEEAATRQLAGLRHSVALKESALEALASRLAEFEDTLREKEALISEKDLEISALSKQRAARLAELEAILVAVSGFRCTLERQPMAEAVEPPELQVLRAQCTRLNHQLQTMSQQFLLCQRELDRHQARREGSAGCGVPTGAAAVETVPRDDLDQDAGSGPVRAVPQGQDPQRQEKPLKDGWLQKVDLLTQVKQLQERLARLVHSVTTQDTGLEGSTHSQPLARVTPALENSLSSVSCSSESTDRLTPADTSNTQETTWGVTEVNEHLDVLTGTRTSNVPIREKMEPQGSPFSLKTGLQSSSEGVEPVRTPARAMDLSWGSPEVVRRDSSLEPPLNLPLTPCSDATGLSSPGCSLLQADDSGLLCYPVPTAKGRALPWVGYPLAVDTPLSTDHHHVERTTAEKDVEDFIITPFDSQENLRSSPLGDGKSDGSEKSDGSGFGEILNEGSERIEAPPASPAAPLQKSGKCQSPPVAMKEREVHAKQVQALLKMVCDESHHILALSEYRRSASTLERGEPCAPLEHVPGEGPGLMEAAPALRGPQKGEKELSDVCVDWRGVFLRAVQDAFEKERHALGVELQSRLGWCEPGDGSYLLERLERVVQEQVSRHRCLGEPSAESLCLSDRSSLLSEIQALRAQLRMTHLQNQEKLQQLCAALTSAEARGSRQEHQLRRQVELLAYKVEQEKCIASDLQKTLSEEQEKATSVRKLLVLEQNAVKDLKSELCECKQENERLLKSLNDVQKEVLQLRSVLDSKEKDLEATLEELEAEHEKERALQSQLEEEQLQHLQREGQSSRALEELRASLEKQCAQNNRLCVALKHEQTAKENLQKELQIECSRCEALLGQERSKLAELQKSMQAEQGRSRELSEALAHERLLTEQLSQRVQEASLPQALLQKLGMEQARVAELQVLLERVQQQAVCAQQRLEAEVQMRSEEIKRERERQGAVKRVRDEHKIEQLQRTVRDLQSREDLRPGGGLCASSPRSAGHTELCFPLELSRLREQQEQLEKVRQQLLCATGLLTSFIHQTVNRTINDWTSSNEKAVASLLQTLEELKSDLSTSTSSQLKHTAILNVEFCSTLRRDYDPYICKLGPATEETHKISFFVNKSVRFMQSYFSKWCVVLLHRPGRAAWKHEKMVLQGSPRHTDPGPCVPAVSEEATTCSIKMEKLYLHYLRAESFRKALIYQKKYLLLLIGGFQDSEQETLSMIAHLGVFPSKADKKATASRPFTKFRTAVRVVVAILRLRFLVRKWQEVDRKGTLLQGRALRPEIRTALGQLNWTGPKASSGTLPVEPGPHQQHHHAGGKGFIPGKGRSTPSPNSRSERSLDASQDPEQSLTEYIHHLEVIQQRLGGIPPESTSKKSSRQKIK
uniref:Pericentrin n=1 Tax=Loxodonta africana TaxID=9785 RepID=G3TJW8_LOXAF